MLNPRLNNIIKFIEIHNPDIISLQEVFSQNCRDILYKFFTQKKYNVLMSPYTRFLLNGGLFIASKYEIVASDIKYIKIILVKMDYVKKEFYIVK